jgi:hypothetical protein
MRMQHDKRNGGKMIQSPTIGALACALSKAQGELEDAGRGRQGHGYKYADLGTVLGEIRPVFSKNGLSVVQTISRFENEITVTTQLCHESGEWVRDDISAPLIIPLNRFGEPTMTDIQATGSITTYLRRYSLAAICGITQIDNDGAMEEEPRRTFEKAPQRRSLPVQAATPGTEAPKIETTAIRQPVPSMMTPETKARLFGSAKAVFGSGAAESLKKIATSIGVPSNSNDLTEAQARQLLIELEKAAQ